MSKLVRLDVHAINVSHSSFTEKDAQSLVPGSEIHILEVFFDTPIGVSTILGSFCPWREASVGTLQVM